MKDGIEKYEMARKFKDGIKEYFVNGFNKEKYESESQEWRDGFDFAFNTLRKTINEKANDYIVNLGYEKFGVVECMRKNEEAINEDALFEYITEYVTYKNIMDEQDQKSMPCSIQGDCFFSKQGHCGRTQWEEIHHCEKRYSDQLPQKSTLENRERTT